LNDGALYLGHSFSSTNLNRVIPLPLPDNVVSP
jgi:hypothetical protein